MTMSPENIASYLSEVNELINLCKFKSVREGLDGLYAQAEADTNLGQQVAALYSQIGCHDKAYNLYLSARALDPADLSLAYNAATAAIAVGRLSEAEKWLDEVIEGKPDDYDAYYNRSTLKKQIGDHNNIAEMEQLLKAEIPDLKGAVQLFYALAKEYEDLGQYDTSFQHLTRGANLRASMLKYRVDDDVATIQMIREAFSSTVLARPEVNEDVPGPIFVVGLPRTGSTLVDRILSAHSDVASLGEINDLAQAIVTLAGPVQSKADLVLKSASIDVEKLAELYQASTVERGHSKPYLLDKTPSNFLYIGMIARAMPNAKIVHVCRHPMDSCFAIYKTLFRMGYPYSYRLEDVADYYAAYHGLMRHWEATMPGRIINVSYEDLVGNFEFEVRRLLERCGLSFQSDCLSFHQNTSPSATASAAQVRTPLYSTSVGRWHSYAAALHPLRARLENHGIDVENVAG